MRWQHQTGAGSASYVVPAGGGVITSWTTNPGPNTGTSTRLEVVRESGSGNAVVGESDVQANIPAHNSASFPTRIAVQAGDVLGLEIAQGATVFCASGGVTGSDLTTRSSDPGPGNTFPQNQTQGSFLVDVSAKVEADADGDGFGDESQDKCPTVPGSVQGCPNADLAITKTASAATVAAGSNVTYTLAAKNNGPDAATGVVVNDALPAGASLVSASSTAGTCSGTSTVTCNVGTLSSGAAATVTVVVKMTSVGVKTDAATVASTADPTGAGDPNPVNNSATATTQVTAPPFTGVSFAGGALRVRNGVVTVAVTSASTATGTLRLTSVIDAKTGQAISARRAKRKTIVLGKSAFSITAGQTAKVKIRLSKRALKLLAKNKRLKATLTAASSDSFGTPATTKKKVVLRPSKRKKKKH